MVVEIDKKDVIRLIRGCEPKYEKMSLFVELGLGEYVGGFADKWVWEIEWPDKWEAYSTKDLYDYYKHILKGDADSYVEFFMSLGKDKKPKDVDSDTNQQIPNTNNGGAA